MAMLVRELVGGLSFSLNDFSLVVDVIFVVLVIWLVVLKVGGLDAGTLGT